MKQLAAAILAAAFLATVCGCTNGAEVESSAPAVPKLAIRVNCGGPEYADDQGNKWQADQAMAEGKTWGAVGGMTIDRGAVEISGTKSPKLYLTERYSMTAYEFGVDNGTYTVRLHFAETFPQHTKAGDRVFGVKINGQEVLTDFDVFQEAGAFAKPVVKQFKGIAVADGKLKIEFAAKTQNAEINAIEILRF